ncbi:uncharacterized GPI-anchored protein At4g28100-like [Typha angustifolia]|uniref:uncharacterized GPI-anchored protein At4g28100-like n=1 Tax=Typha angustifolia TaxID=59011 RepID=UPI003C2C18C5
MGMRPMPQFLLPFLLIFFSFQPLRLPALPVLPDLTTIQAFPEQSDAAAGACPLDPSDALLPAVSAACTPQRGLLARSRCCPALAAWLYAAYARTALAAARPLSTAAALDLPVLPDDSEDCAGGVDRALRSRGVELPRANGTCDAAFCYCGIRLRRLTCLSASASFDNDGRWAPSAVAASRLERECAKPGLAGCTRCLRAVSQLKNGTSAGGNLTAVERKHGDHHQERECQLMGLTWLLAKNGTHYLPAATGVLRTLMAAGAEDQTSCSVPVDDMPLAVDSAQIDGSDGSSAVRSSPLPAVSFFLLALTLSSSSLSFRF